MKRRQPETGLVFPGSAGLDIAALLGRASPALLVVGTWLAYHPYLGIVHDARLYVAQMLHALHPDVFSADLFFAFGSQDDFSLFGRLFAPLLAHMGASAAAMLVVVLGQMLWLSGAAALALRLAPNRAAAVAGLVLVSGLPAFYGGWEIFSFGEGFATPRLLAEGAALWTLWALAGRRLAVASVLVVLTAFLHPIVALSVLSVGFCFLVLQDRRWIALGVAAAALAAVLVYVGIGPFAGFDQTMDPEWLDAVEQRNIFVFPGQWRTMDWARVAMTASAALAAAAVLDGWRRHILVAVTLAGFVSVAAAIIGADLLHNVLMIQLQTWRTLWLLHVFAYLGAGILLARLWESKPDGLALISLVVLVWLNDRMLHPNVSGFVGAFVFGLVALRLRGVLRPLPFVIQAASVTLACLLVVVLAVCRVVVVENLMRTVSGNEGVLQAFGLATVIELSFAAAAVFFLVRFFPGPSRTALPIAAAILVIVSAASWDRRTGWSRMLETDAPVSAFDAKLPSDAQVYWEGEVLGPWLRLGRPSYFSVAQGAGILFHRETALTFRDRARVVEPLMGQQFLNHVRYREEVPPPLPALTRDMLADTCRRDRALDAMVLSRVVDGAYAATWDLPKPLYEPVAAQKGSPRPPITRYYLYRCSDLG